MSGFYDILESKIVSENPVIKIRVKAGHPIYTGHFPGFPVMPGALLLKINKELSEMILKKKIKFLEAMEIKFLKSIVPSESDPLMFSFYIREENGIHIRSEIRVRDIICFKMRAIYIIE